MSRITDILTQVGALYLNDHFVGTSGRHLEGYINKDALYPHTNLTSEVCNLFAEKHKHLPIDVIAGPALGGIILSQWTAHHLSQMTGKEILSVYTEKKNDELQFTRGYNKLVQGKNVLVVEDLTTTGGSLQKVITEVQKAGGHVTAATVMVNKDPELVNEQTFGVPFSALGEVRINSYEESECLLCQKGVPVNTSVGHGAKFVASKS